MILNKVYSLLGLCMKAGKLVSGEFSVEKGIKDGSVSLVIIASDASDNTKKKFNDMSSFRNIKLITIGDKVSLGNAIGKEIRASIGICDEGFSKSILTKLMSNNEDKRVNSK